VDYLGDIGSEEEVSGGNAGGGYVYSGVGTQLVRTHVYGSLPGQFRTTLPSVDGDVNCAAATRDWVLYRTGFGGYHKIRHDGTGFQRMDEGVFEGAKCPEFFLDEERFYDGTSIVHIDNGVLRAAPSAPGDLITFHDGDFLSIEWFRSNTSTPENDRSQLHVTPLGSGASTTLGARLEGRVQIVSFDDEYVYYTRRDYIGGGPNTTPPGFRYRITFDRMNRTNGEVTEGIEILPGGPREPGITPWAYKNGVLYYVQSKFGDPTQLQWVNVTF